MSVNSMTGFGSARGESERYRLRVDVRAVNHRFLDVVVRVKEPCRSSEPALRTLVNERLHRGRVEVSVDVDVLLPPRSELSMDEELVNRLVAMVDELRESAIEVAPLAAGDLLRTPGVITVTSRQSMWDDEDEGRLLAVAGAALDQLQAGRRREGELLAAELGEGFGRLAGVVDELVERREGVTGHYLERLRERLSSLTGGEALPDRQRLEQEVALLVERSDVREEVERLRAHVQHGGEILSEASPIGKRLDFLLQEILRELNTVGAKCRDLAMTRLVLEARLVCEQMREQVQNVE